MTPERDRVMAEFRTISGLDASACDRFSTDMMVLMRPFLLEGLSLSTAQRAAELDIRFGTYGAFRRVVGSEVDADGILNIIEAQRRRLALHLFQQRLCTRR